MPISLSIRNNGANGLVTVYNFLLGKVQISFLYFGGLIVMGFQCIGNALTIMKPVRVSASNP